MSNWWKILSGMAIFIGYGFLCIFAFKFGISSAKTPPLEFPEFTPYTAQAHYSIHASITKGGAIEMEGFCGEYVPSHKEPVEQPQTRTEEGRSYQIVQMINSITDQKCDATKEGE